MADRMKQDNETSLPTPIWDEKTCLDSIAPPYDVINAYPNQHGLPFHVSSIGRYREGIRFNDFLYGFTNCSITLTLNGTGQTVYRGQTVELSRGDIAFFDNFECRSSKSLTEEWAFCFVNIYGEICGIYEKLWNQNGFCVIHTENIPFYEACFETINSNMNRTELSCALEINLAVQQILSAALLERERTMAENRPKPRPTWVVEAARYISENCATDVRIEELADRFFMNRVYFSRQFKQYMGVAPKEYLTLSRIEAAAILLRTTAKPIAEIAAESGFASQSFFTQTFQRHYGKTPSAYRKTDIQTV